MIDTDKQIAAAEAHAANYDGDVREGIKTDVLNAFYAGVKFAIEGWSNGSEPVISQDRDEAYDEIDRHLRNTMDDVCYAGASQALEIIYAVQQPAIPPGWREAIESISEFGDDTLCDEALQSIYASRENTEAALRIAVRLTKQEAIEKLEKLAAVQAQPEIPPVLFDGYAVYQALGNAQARTSPENVSDVLDAVVRLIRAEAPEATK